jgi:transcriptional regulator with GAF, ATPase, and Fis domain
VSTETQTLPRAATRLPSAPPIQARLVVVHPPAVTGVLALPSTGEVHLGRASASAPAGLAIADGTISRQHAVLRAALDTGGHAVGDTGSRNGTFLNGAPLSPGGALHALADQDVLRFGDVLAVYECGRGVALAADDRDPPAVSRHAAPGVSAAAVALRWHLSRAAPDPSPCLITGETGTGKELLAAEVHRLSGRAGPVVTLNCAALSPQLVESQLFGHARGAFTGAVAPQPGLFRAAEGGTLFLDEIGELPLDLQPKLLRAIQEREVQPVGETRGVRVNVRVVAATHRDLAELVERGLFRRDLYARLVLWQVSVPPLRARRADVPGWLSRLDTRWRAERPRAGTTPLSLDADTAERLLLADWPENLRGVDRLVHTVAGDGGGAVTLARLAQLGVPLEAPATASPHPESTPSEAAESARPPTPDAATLAALLAECGGSVRAVARRLGRDRKQVYRWLERHGLRAAAEPGED